jgi:hypothetical protein
MAEQNKAEGKPYKTGLFCKCGFELTAFKCKNALDPDNVGRYKVSCNDCNIFVWDKDFHLVKRIQDRQRKREDQSIESKNGTSMDLGNETKSKKRARSQND